MIEIKLTQNKIAIVDDCDAHLTNFRWCFNSGYASRNFSAAKNNQRKIFLHHAIIGYPLNGLCIDHVDGNPMNNRRNNLRIVTVVENACNRKDKNKKSKYIGVYWHSGANKWRPMIWDSGRLISLGLFDNELEAREKYDIALADRKVCGNSRRISMAKSVVPDKYRSSRSRIERRVRKWMKKNMKSE